MKRFKFRLEPVLKYRKIIKDQQEARLVRAQMACRETEADLEALKNKKAEAQAQMAENAKLGFSLIEHEASEIYNKKLDKERSVEKVRLAKRHKAIEFERKKLVKASIEEKSIEKLKDKQKKLYQAEFLQWEMKQIDDLVNTRTGLKDNYGHKS